MRPTPESGSLHPCCHIVCFALSVAVCRLTRRALQPRRRQDSARHKTHWLPTCHRQCRDPGKGAQVPYLHHEASCCGAAPPA